MEGLLLALVLLVVGLILLGIEMFIIPGFGLFGVAGLMTLAGGCWVAWAQHGMAVGIASVVVSVVAVGIGVWVLARTRAGKLMVLTEEIRGESTDRESMQHMVGARGEATSDLRPSGTGLFGGDRRQVLTDGEYVKKGTAIEVVRVGTNTLIVAPRTPNQATERRPDSVS